MKCCFCGKEITGYGNNPWPANKQEDARCCDHCNEYIVIGARLEYAFLKKEEREKGSQ